MPNRAVHQTVGAGCGAVAALWCAPQNGDPKDRFIEMLGGALGGYHGGRLPDIIDPPTHPRHRSVGHAVLSNGLVAKIFAENIADAQQFFRNASAVLQQASLESKSDGERVLLNVLSALCLFAAGYVVGVGAGVASHLVLDGGSPAGLPFLN